MNGLNLYGDLFAEINRLQQSLDGFSRPSGASSIRAMPRHTFPVVNVGSTRDAFEVLALTPGVDPAQLQLTIDKGMLVLSSERPEVQPDDDKLAVYARERYAGTFRRVISLPEDADPAAVTATCRDGLLRISVARRASSKPRQIQIQ